MKRLLLMLILIALFVIPLLMIFNKMCLAVWAPMPSGTSENLSAVWGSSGSDVFAVGFNGTILHYDGMTEVPPFYPLPLLPPQLFLVHQKNYMEKDPRK